MLHTQKLGNQAENASQGARKAMPADEFCRWMAFMGWRIVDVSSRLGVSRNTVSSYRQNGADEQIRRACRDLAVEFRKDELVEVSISYPWEICS